MAAQLSRAPLGGHTLTRLTLAVLLTLGGATLGCGDLGEILTLQQELVREFQTPAIGININNQAHLTVTFSNSPTADLAEPEQAAFARRVAEYVRDHYAGYPRLQSINVGFATVRGTGAVKFTSTRVPYHYTPQELGPPLVEPKKLAPKAAA